MPQVSSHPPPSYFVHAGQAPAIAVVGAGALGHALAGALVRLGFPVELVLRDGVEGGRFSLRGRISGEFELPAVGWSDFLARARTLRAVQLPEIWVTVRAWQLQSLWRELPAVAHARTWVGCNGLGWADELPMAGRFLAWFGSKRLDGATPTFELSLGGGIEWARRGTGDLVSPGLRAVAAFFSGVAKSEFDSLEAVEWRKAIWNATLNPLAALSRGLNGEVVQNPVWRLRFERAVAEGVAVARTRFGEVSFRSIFGSEGEFLSHLVRATEGTAENRNSLLVDLEARRSTELPWLLDRVREDAHLRGVSVPELDRVASELGTGRS